jgi:hypothetical protein
MAGKEPQLEPAEDRIHDRLGEADVFIAGPAGGLKTVVGKLLDQELERNACWSESEQWRKADGHISVYPAWIRRRYRPQERRIEKAPLDE